MSDADRLITELKAALGTDLKSVVLYGSGVSHAAKGGAQNVAVVAADLSAATLGRLAGPLETWAKGGHPPAALFSEASLSGSLDVFPIEFLDMRDRHTVLHGPDPLAGAKIDTRNLRHQIEYELRAASMKLRTRYLARRLAPNTLAIAVADALPSVTALFRALLRLLEKPAPDEPREVWRALAQAAPVDDGVFEDAARVRAARLPAGQARTHAHDDIERVFERFMAAVDAAITVTDRLA